MASVAEEQLDKALAVAVQLAREATEAGLVVTAISPHRCRGRYGCHFIQLWMADGGLWAEASHETTASVRDHVARYRRHLEDLRKLRAGSPVHLCPPEGVGLTSCCGRPPMELPSSHRITLDRGSVTCPGRRWAPGVAGRNAAGSGDAPLLGLATTRELMHEVEVRAMISRLDPVLREHWPVLRELETTAARLLAALPRPVLEYRTVDS